VSRPLFASLTAGIALVSCGGGGSSAGVTPPVTGPPPRQGIAHVVVLVQENRTFNNLFATFPGALGTTTGKMRVGNGKNERTVSVTLKKVGLTQANTLRHSYPAYATAYRDGNMDAFNRIVFQRNGQPEGKLPYQYADPAQIQPYWTMAKQYGLADHMFQTQGSGSFTAHQDLIAGGTQIDPTDSIIDDPTQAPWGCPAPPGARTSLITTSLQYKPGAGPFPCLTYKTVADLLDAKGVSWKYYTPDWNNLNVGALWNAFLAISAVYNDANEWNSHIATPETTIFNDISNGTLPAVSWVIPNSVNSDHPGFGSDKGPSWVASVVNAVGHSSYWGSTVIVIVWDDWGGFYDAVAPPQLDDQGGPGFRVPMIVVSPYVPPNEISHRVYYFGSILRFIEDRWHLGRLGTSDTTSTSIAGMLNLKQSPRAFATIQARYSRSFFLTRRPSALPVDTE
jgi:phospholipase C